MRCHVSKLKLEMEQKLYEGTFPSTIESQNSRSQSIDIKTMDWPVKIIFMEIYLGFYVFIIFIIYMLLPLNYK